MDGQVVRIYDEEKYEIDEDQFIVMHYDQLDMFLKWLVNLKQQAIKERGFDVLKIKTST